MFLSLKKSFVFFRYFNYHQIMYFYRIILGFSLYTLVYGNEEFERDIEGITLSNNISKLEKINHLITETESYNGRINEINLAYNNYKYPDEMSKIRLDYELGLLKRHLFSHYFQCSQASFALQYLRIIHKNIIDKGDRRQVNTISKTIYDVILKMMAILLHINYSPPKWMMMISLFSDDLFKKSYTNYSSEKYTRNMRNYVIADILKIMEIIKSFLSKCNTHLKVTEQGPYSKFKIDDKVHGYTSDLNRLNELNEAIQSSITVLNHKSYESFRSDQWLLSQALLETQTFFLKNPEQVGINWNGIDNNFREKVNKLFSDIDNRNVVLETYLSPHDMIDIQNFLKNIYRIVVIRFVYVGVNICDNMRTQIGEVERNPMLEKMFTQKCTPLNILINEAIQFLDGDEFLEDMKPLISEFVSSPMAIVSSIQIKTLSMLNHLASFMGVDALGIIEPKYENLELLKESVPAVNSLFQWVSSFFEDSLSYTNQIVAKFPYLNFRVVEYIQNSAKNEWIHHGNPK